MYSTTRNIAGDTFMTCKDFGHALGMNKMCETPLKSATDSLKHLAIHTAFHAFAAAGRVPSKLVRVCTVSGKTLSAVIE
jgi:hypothetical protein